MRDRNKEDSILLAKIDDMIYRWKNDYTVEATQFLDMHQRSVVENFLMLQNKGYAIGQKGRIDYRFFGGYEGAERVRCYLMQEYASTGDFHDICAIKVAYDNRERRLSHRDFLGSILGLGIKREKIGDIIVGEDHGYILLSESILNFVLNNFCKVGRASVNVEIVPVESLAIYDAKYDDLWDTVASTRADNVISSMFNISRSKAAEAIKNGLVFCNNLEISKVDRQIQAGDKMVLRGRGKAVLVEIGDKSRKGRTYIRFHRYT